MNKTKEPKDELNFHAEFRGEKHEHLWGYELWIENNSKYCSKLLVLNNGCESSWHYHKRKDETFVILSGEVSLSYASKPDGTVKVIILKEGDKFRIVPGVVHCFKSLTEKSVVMEVSTTDDGDNVKLRPARKLEQ